MKNIKTFFVFLLLLSSAGMAAQENYVVPESISTNPQTDSRFHNILNGFAAQMKSMDEVYNEIMSDSTISAEKRSEKAQSTMYALHTALLDSITANIRCNVDTPIGAEILGLYYSNLPLETVDSILSLIPEQCMTEKARAAKLFVEAKKRSAEGNPMIDFTLKTPDGKDLKLSDVVKVNKVTMIDFWASWCGPCHAEMPHVKKAYEAFHDHGFQILGVSLDDKAERWTKAIESWQLPWLHASDLKGWKSDAAAVYGVRAIPATFLISQDGQIIAVNLRGDALYGRLAEIFN